MAILYPRRNDSDALRDWLVIVVDPVDECVVTYWEEKGLRKLTCIFKINQMFEFELAEYEEKGYKFLIEPIKEKIPEDIRSDNLP